MTQKSPSPPFKRCPCCSHEWPDRKDFLQDPALTLVGYMVNFEVLELGLFLFNHETCHSTIAVPAAAFIDLHQGQPFSTRLNGTSACSAMCLHQDDLEPCPEACECAYVRDVLSRVKTWPKRI